MRPAVEPGQRLALHFGVLFTSISRIPWRPFAAQWAWNGFKRKSKRPDPIFVIGFRRLLWRIASPVLPHRSDFRTEPELRRVAVKRMDQVQDSQDVICNCDIHTPEVHGVPAAVFLGIVPGQEEVGHLPGLAGATGGDMQQSR